jgi:uncharacterized protein (UPF0335 family)
MSKVGGDIAGDRLLSFMERIFHIDDEIRDLNEAKKEIFLEAKADGFDLKVLKEVLRVMKKNKDERDEHESLVDAYLSAIEAAKPAAMARAA